MSNEPKPLTPEEIYDYMHEEHTPYSNMTAEEGKAHICQLITRWGDWHAEQKTLTIFTPD